DSAYTLPPQLGRLAAGGSVAGRGRMATLTVDKLREQVRGEVIAEGDDAYEIARRVYNAMIDKRPSVVVRPANAGDVVAAVNFAREGRLDLSIRSGSHSVPGFGTNDGGVVIDLSRMRGVRVDPAAKTARAEGGGGNFGVLTSLKFKLSPIKDIYGGPMFFDMKDAETVLKFYRDYIKDAPEEMGVSPAWQIAPPLPFIPEQRHGVTHMALVGCWAGALDKGEREFKPFHDVANVVAEFVGPMPYPALNSAFDGLVPLGLQHYWKANFVKELSDKAIEAHVEHGPKIPAVNSTVHIYPINGA